MRWDQADLTDDDCAGSKIAPRQTLPAGKPPPPNTVSAARGSRRSTVADAMREPLRRTIVDEDAGEATAGWSSASPQVRVQSARAQPDEEAHENVIDALRELLAARFGSPPELPYRTGSD
jgi:hypothetical protein